MEKIKTDPGYQRGLSLLKDRGNLIERLAGLIDDVPDATDHKEMKEYGVEPPGVGADDIPF